MDVLYKVRRDTSANWYAVNPILADGEMGYEKDTGKMKIGDGVLQWNSRPYWSATETSETIIGSQSQLSTTATDGFTYIPTCAGIPSGIPTAYTGKVALVYDTVNNKLYCYNNGWKGASHT